MTLRPSFRILAIGVAGLTAAAVGWAWDNGDDGNHHHDGDGGGFLPPPFYPPNYGYNQPVYNPPVYNPPTSSGPTTSNPPITTGTGGNQQQTSPGHSFVGGFTECVSNSNRIDFTFAPSGMPSVLPPGVRFGVLLALARYRLEPHGRLPASGTPSGAPATAASATPSGAPSAVASPGAAASATPSGAPSAAASPGVAASATPGATASPGASASPEVSASPSSAAGAVPQCIYVEIPQGAAGMGTAAYGRNPLVVPNDTTVIWVNDDSVAHTVTADDGSFDSGALRPGQTSLVDLQPGRILSLPRHDLRCSKHVRISCGRWRCRQPDSKRKSVRGPIGICLSVA